MANEAVLVNLDNDVHYFTIVNQAIPKGTLMVLSADPRTVTLHSALEQIPMGYTVEEVLAGDGQVRIGCRGRGIIDIIADGTITLGDLVEPGQARNDVRSLTRNLTLMVSQAGLRNMIGSCLETASDNEAMRQTRKPPFWSEATENAYFSNFELF